MSRKRGFSFHDPEYDAPPEAISQHQAALQPIKTGTVQFAKGQQWASDMEPELGIGTITEVTGKRLSISFQDGACIRAYATTGAPLRRIIFGINDSIRLKSGQSFTVDNVVEHNNIVQYHASDSIIPESELSCTLRFASPFDRIKNNHTDTSKDFVLRQRAIDCRLHIDKSPVRGFTGARIDCIPHQLYICNDIVSHYKKRVLLADEVGLGKTIEACLVLHRLLVCNTAQRVIICVPESIVHVWFVELLRKFNMIFRIMDNEFFEGAQAQDKNPFLLDQLVLCSIGFLTENENALACAHDAGWDVLIVDEAHHLIANSPQFDCIQKLANASRDALFLTATPQQNGTENHFARLKLLDPSRYTNFETFVRESRRHAEIAQITTKLCNNVSLDDSDTKLLAKLVPNVSVQKPATNDALVANLLDRYGIGRAMYRNTRQAVGGFPKRIVDIAALSGPPSQTETIQKLLLDNLANNNLEKPGEELSYSQDMRFPWFTDLLKKYPDDKFLVICMRKETAKAIEKALLRHMTVSIGLFHEELSLIQRDRNAAFFAQDDGARILLCSEIGSEGRNFQFCRHLVFWDLPLDCELVEQRIGRLDRIGQKNDVIIHVPCIQNTCMEVLCRWYHEGIDIFSHAVPAAQEVFETCKEALVTIATTACKTPDSWRKDLESLILAAKKAVALQTAELEAGRDRLLELHSYRPQPAQAIVNAIKAMDTDTFLELFFLDLLKANGVFFELIGKRTYKLWSESPLDETFPALRTSRPLITFDRATALTREDMEFVTIDHPAVRNGLDSFLGSDKGNACLATWKGCKETGLLLETVFVVECIAPPELNVERFLPPTPIRFVIDHTGKERPDICALTNFENKVSECLDIPLLQNETVQQTLLPALQKKAMALASAKSEPVITAAQQEMQKAVGSEVKRLIELAAINPSISQDEIDLSKEALETLNRLIKAAEPRLDSVRLIWMDKGK